jgi:hypothetical protein
MIKAQLKYYLPLLCAVVCFSLFLARTPVIVDDLALINKYTGITLSDEWNNILFDYYHWSSRVLINAAIHIFLGHRKIYWVIISAFLFAVSTLALDKIFNQEKNREKNVIIILFFLIFPFSIVSYSGWIVGSISYYWTIACAIVGIVPLVMSARDEKVSPLIVVISTIMLIYAANFEQCIAVLLILFTGMLIYFLRNKKVYKVIFFQYFVLLASLIFILTAPGNSERAQTEGTIRFKDFIMLNPFDKIDLGFSSTMQKLIFTENSIFLLLSILLAVYVLLNYRSKLFRFISLIPVTVIVISGYLKIWIIAEYSQLSLLFGAVPMNGQVTVDNYLLLYPYIKIMIYFVTCITVLISIYLVFGNNSKSVFGISLFIGGVASRVMLGLSPSVWVSGDRTYLCLYFCILMISLMIALEIKKEDKKGKVWTGVQFILFVFASLSVLASLTLV